jgi:hypothetical protein
MGHRAATRLLTLIVLLFSLTLLVGCTQEEDYYTKAELDALIEELDQEYNYYHAELSRLRDEVWATRAELEQYNAETQMQRFFYSLIENELLGGEMVFAEIGDTIEGVVDDWDYGYIIIELDRTATVQIEFTTAAPNGEWDLNLYLNAIDNYSQTFEGIQVGQKYTLYLNPGFNVIEIDSYYDFTYPFVVKITEVV